MIKTVKLGHQKTSASYYVPEGEPKRLSYEEVYAERSRKIDHLNLTELQAFRKELIEWKYNIELMMKEPNIKPGRRQYLIGLRNHVVLNLLNETKRRRKELNVMINNGSKSDVMRRFMNRAAEVLPIDTFQEIYGYAIMEQSEIDEEPN